jgi:hypothetical protein
MNRRLALLAAFPFALAAPARATIFTVTNTNDGGAGSLREAIEDANTNPLPDRIEFAIPGNGPHVIAPLGPFETIQDELTIDAPTQPGASCDAWPPTLQIVLDGSDAGADIRGLIVSGDDSVVRGLVIHSFDEHGIQVSNAADVQIECNFVGTDETGTVDLGNGNEGVHVQFAPNTTVGGPSPTQRNLLSGNTWYGIRVGQDSEDSEVIGNYVGTDVTGMLALPNDATGVYVTSPDVTVGGPGPAAGNLIAANVGHGLTIGFSASGALVFSNRIGVDATGEPVLGNMGSGILVTNDAVDSMIGGPPFEDQPLGNLIAGNQHAGVSVYLEGNTGHAIRYNAIFANGDLGIALVGPDDTPLANDPDDADEGTNRLQNFPVIASADWHDGTATLELAYRVPTHPDNAAYPITVDFYRADADGPEGEAILASDTFSEGDFTGSTDPKEVSLLALDDVEPGDRLVAVATDAEGNSSEFGASVVVPEAGAVTSGAAAAGMLASRAARRARDRASHGSARG